ncbi:MAG: hypothetical protein V3W41_06270 [Planctomycetota bacterium]
MKRDQKISKVYAQVQKSLAAEFDRKIYCEVAKQLDRDGDLKRTLAAARLVIELDPQSAIAHFELAKYLIKSGDYLEGGKQLEVCSELDSVEVAGRRWQNNNLYYIAYVFFNLGRYQEAADAFRGAQNLIDIWSDPVVLKNFLWHQGFALHECGQFLDAAECYRRAMVAPGPGDSCIEDEMDEDEVEAAQALNDEIEPYMELAQKGVALELNAVEVTPAFST